MNERNIITNGRKAVALLLLSLIISSCTSNTNDVVYDHIREIQVDSQSWKRKLESELSNKSIDFTELKRQYFRYNLTTPQLYREVNVFKNQYRLDVNMNELRNLLDQKDKLLGAFYSCESETINNQKIRKLIEIETKIHKWLSNVLALLKNK